MVDLGLKYYDNRAQTPDVTLKIAYFDSSYKHLIAD